MPCCVDFTKETPYDDFTTRTQPRTKAPDTKRTDTDGTTRTRTRTNRGSDGAHAGQRRSQGVTVGQGRSQASRAFVLTFKHFQTPTTVFKHSPTPKSGVQTGAVQTHGQVFKRLFKQLCSNVNQRGAQAAASGGFAASLRARSCENTNVTKSDNQVE